MTNYDLSEIKIEKLRRYYRTHPVAYCKDVLDVTLWGKQIEIAESIVNNQRTFVTSGHGTGKSHLISCLINWHFDCFDSIGMSTAPSAAQVDDVIWTNVRKMRNGRPGLMPKASQLSDPTNPRHYSSGLTARSAEAFQGRHEKDILLLFDECVGIDADFFLAADGMIPEPSCKWLCTCNPTDTSTEAYNRYISGLWNCISINCMDHPNIISQLSGGPIIIPGAVEISYIYDSIRDWCDPISSTDATAMDFEFPPHSGNWYRPGALFEAKVMGRFPSGVTTSIWTEAMWLNAQKPQPIKELPLKIGCDVARFGDDNTVIVARRGNCVLWHETHNGWSTAQTAHRLRELASEYSAPGENPRMVDIYIDDSGVGGGVVDQATGFRFIGINSSEKAIETEDYPNRRSELWFTVAKRANRGELDLSRLSQDSLRIMRQQALAPTWKMDSAGRRVVEPKDQTKKRIKRSPDDLDALNLAFTAFEPSALAIAAPERIIDMPTNPMGTATIYGQQIPVSSGFASSKPTNRIQELTRGLR